MASRLFAEYYYNSETYFSQRKVRDKTSQPFLLLIIIKPLKFSPKNPWPDPFVDVRKRFVDRLILEYIHQP